MTDTPKTAPQVSKENELAGLTPSPTEKAARALDQARVIRAQLDKGEPSKKAR